MAGDVEFFRVSKATSQANALKIAAQDHAGAKTADLGPGDSTSFPTWSFWGVTNVRLTNRSPVRLPVILQAGAAPAQHWELTPEGQDGSVVQTSGQWAALPVWLTNASADPAALLHIEVW